MSILDTDLSLPHEQSFIVVGSEKEAAVLCIPEVLDQISVEIQADAFTFSFHSRM